MLAGYGGPEDPDLTGMKSVWARLVNALRMVASQWAPTHASATVLPADAGAAASMSGGPSRLRDEGPQEDHASTRPAPLLPSRSLNKSLSAPTQVARAWLQKLGRSLQKSLSSLDHAGSASRDRATRQHAADAALNAAAAVDAQQRQPSHSVVQIVQFERPSHAAPRSLKSRPASPPLPAALQSETTSGSATDAAADAESSGQHAQAAPGGRALGTWRTLKKMVSDTC